MPVATCLVVGAVAFFWNATRPHPPSGQLWRAAVGLAFVAAAVAVAPVPARDWVTQAVEAMLLMAAVGLAAALVMHGHEQRRDYRADLAAGRPARRPHWPTLLVMGAWFLGCLSVAWLLGEGLQYFDQVVLSPLFDALDPAKVDTPEVTRAVTVIMGIMTISIVAAVVATLAVPLVAGYLHHRKVQAAERNHDLEWDDYLATHRDAEPTGAIAVDPQALHRGY